MPEFVTLTAHELDPWRDGEIVNDDDLVRRLTRIECPDCGWFEVRPITLSRHAQPRRFPA